VAFSLLLLSSLALGNTSTQEGDLNNNYQGATVDSNNETTSHTNQYNGSGSSADKIPVNTAVAPSLMSGGNDSCLQSTSGGVQSTVVGFSSGKYIQDEECNRRKDAAVLKNLGMSVAAVARMCQAVEVWESMFNSGTPCPLTVNGKLVVGKAAFIMMRREPEMFIPNYKDKQEYYDMVLGGSSDEETDSSSGTISERFRTNRAASSGR